MFNQKGRYLSFLSGGGGGELEPDLPSSQASYCNNEIPLH